MVCLGYDNIGIVIQNAIVVKDILLNDVTHSIQFGNHLQM